MNNFIKRLLLILITCVFLYFVFRNIDIKEFTLVLKEFNFKLIPLLVLCVIFSMFSRALTFKILISETIKKISLFELLNLCISCASLNIVLPARAGDIYRAFYTGEKYNADKLKLFGSVMLERIFDGLIILFILILAIYTYQKNPLAQKLCLTGALLFIGSFVLAIMAFKFNKTDEICQYLENKTEVLPVKLHNFFKSFINFIKNKCNSFLDGFEIFNNPKKIIPILITSAGIWFFECLNYYIVITGFNIDIGCSVVLFIIPFTALACMIPSTSIYIGPYQFAVIAAFAMYNVTKESALAISLLQQAVTTIFCSFVAVIFFLRQNINLKDIQKDIESENKILQE